MKIQEYCATLWSSFKDVRIKKNKNIVRKNNRIANNETMELK